MKINTKPTFAGLAVMAVTLLFQPITHAGNPAQPVAPSNPFVTLLEGIYEPVTDVPDLGLGVDINDGTVVKITIYNTDSGVPTPTDPVIGTFYVQLGGLLCAYDFPKGNILAQFTPADDEIISNTFYPDPVVGPSWILVANWGLDILEATGIYQSFQGGRIHMVDRLEYRDGVGLVEHCFCEFSRKHGKP
jgi:hypothetical protein